MSDSALLSRLKNDMKTAMREKQKARLAVIRMLLAATKQKEVDERITLTDNDVLAILTKQVKQRRESVRQYTEAGREALADQEQAEIDIIQSYLPEPLSEVELNNLITQAVADSGATGMQDMGKIMGLLKPQIQGRADMSQVSQQIKQQLSH